METKVSTKVPVTEQDRLKSYFKYYNMDMVPAPKEKYDLVLKGPVDPKKALKFKDRNDLFKPGYLDVEVGYCVMEDGTGFVANLTKMPGVTVEMFDWWFAWHGLDNLRYTIWDPEDHYKAETMQREKAKDPDLSYKERYWDTTHHVVENIGMGPEGLFINFKNPANLGFDASKIGTEACGTIVCAKGNGEGQPPFASPPTIMTHFIREIEGGVELRTRFWMGWTVVNGKDVKALPDGIRMPAFGPMALCLHNIKEFTNLAAILPKIYAEEKDNF
ncbi:phloretin hydrolase [Clostridium sp. SYSU_GA19001]|uniref:DAPG hydrolase family protein n=1 Tax=Clostridium caldaquaticum TaxID=2940653 RepID=UPI00207708A5|nr:phloretin hydrolase [Clostridium caldaquaticum]MCM8711220.1 phloretin hydrolase [Clostridium caldaquaticum]